MRAPIVAAAIFLLAAWGPPTDSSMSEETHGTAHDVELPAESSPLAQARIRAVHVCPGPNGPDEARCHARVMADATGVPLANQIPRTGYGPSDLRAAYGLGTAATGNWVWNGETVAVVDAFGYPSAEDDLKVYRAYYHLPPCTTANGCFRKIDQRGGTNYPRSNCGWAQETALDIQMVSAICPQCKILLVQADSNSFANLGAAVNQAVAQGASVISNSYGASESLGSMSYASYYDHPGVALTVSSGDSSYGVEVPAAFSTVTAVGGTTLRRDSTTARGWTETAWSGSGSGCSSYVPKPSWQNDACTTRTVADVAAVADPATGVAVYDSFKCQGASGWLTFGGTSVAAPIIAGVYGAAGSATDLSFTYAHPAGLHDVTSGSNGQCGGSYLCSAGPGYDGPTGLGTPNGTGSF
jgi:subtilase family serine protease